MLIVGLWLEGWSRCRGDVWVSFLLLAEPWAGLAGYGCSGPLGTRGSKYIPAGPPPGLLWPSRSHRKCNEPCSGIQACIFPGLGALMLERQSPEMEG